jgi:E3 ubiquitin-protein ligase synoviolin
MEEEDPTAAAAAAMDDVPPLIPDDGDGASEKLVFADNNNDEEDAAMEAMMAFQEEQEEGAGLDNNTNNNNNNNNGNDGFIGIIDDDAAIDDPNVAFLGDNNNDEAEEGDNRNVVLLPLNNDHPNHFHPAALALRRRQLAAANNNHAPGIDNNNHAARGNIGILLRNKVPNLSTLIRPLLRYVPLSMLAALALLHHTFRTRQQFYIVMTYLQTSKLSYVILGNAIIATTVGFFSTITSLFLDGGLRPNERDSIGESIRWDVTETCLALTIFRSELDVGTAIQFLVLVLMKCLHWSVELRGGHLRMTEDVFVYDNDDDVFTTIVNDTRPTATNTTVERRGGLSFWHRLPRIRLTHVSYYSLIIVLLVLDILAVSHCALSVATHGPSVDILFGFEAAILLVSGVSSLGMYHLHVLDGIMGVIQHLATEEVEDEQLQYNVTQQVERVGEGEDAGEGMDRQPQDPLRQEGGAETVAGVTTGGDVTPTRTPTKTIAKKLVERLANPWRDRRAMMSFAIELQAQAAKFLFYVVFFAIVFTYYGMPINIFREVYVSFQQLRRRLIAFNTYRRLTHNMDKRFEPIKDDEELTRAGHTCIICRDSMDCLGGCVKLPGCGHAFHKHCLRDWLVQQQTCPTCRSDIAANEAREKKKKEREAAEATAAAAAAEAEARATPAPVPGDNATAIAATVDRNEPLATSQQLDQRQTSSTLSSSIGNVSLPLGWTQYIDGNSGRVYYCNRELGVTTWEKPALETAVTSPSETTTMAAPQDVVNNPSSSFDVIMHANDFPCLYRISRSTGARVYDSRAVQQRLIPRGKLVVCTSFEYWPREIMLRIPGGYVRPSDVERFLMLQENKAK